MEAAIQTKTLTAEEFFTLPDHGGRNELVRGEVVPMSPASTHHGRITMRLAGYLWEFVREQSLGEVYAAETGFTIFRDPDTVRAPDIAFIARTRIPPEGEPGGFWAIAPDLVAEVVSPYDRMSEVQDKVTDYLQPGVRLVWLVDPQTQTMTVYESLDHGRILLAEDVLEGGEVLPGFRLPLSRLFQ